MEPRDDFRIEEELLGSESGVEFVGEWSCPTQQSIVKQTGKGLREPTVKAKKTKKMGTKGKVHNAPMGWVRPLFAHDENYQLVQCFPHLRLLLVEKRGDTLRASFATRVSFDKYSCTTPRQRMHRHNISSPNDLEIVV